MAFDGLVSKLLLKYATNVISKQNATNSSSLKTFHQLPNVAQNLICYTSACEEDPELKSFDSSLYIRTSKLIESLSAQEGQTGDLSLDSITEVCGFLNDLSEGVVKIITDSKEDVLKNEELKSLVDLYFGSTTNTLNLFNTVENCVKKTKIIQMKIRIAIKQFEKESMDTDFMKKKKKKKYEETLEELIKIKAMEDPFGDEFANQYQSIYVEQLVLLGKFREMQVELDKNLKDVKKTRRLVNAAFATALVSVCALSLVLCAVAAPHVVAAVAVGFIPTAISAATATASASVQIAGRWIWVNKMYRDCEEALKNEKGLIQLMENGMKFNIEAMKTIKNLVEKLILSISFILNAVEDAVQRKEEEEVIKIVMQEIIKNVDEFSDKIEEVGEHVANCSKSVAKGKVHVLEYITNSVSPKRKW